MIEDRKRKSHSKGWKNWEPGDRKRHSHINTGKTGKRNYYDVWVRRKFKASPTKFTSVHKHGRTTKLGWAKGPSGHMCPSIISVTK